MPLKPRKPTKNSPRQVCLPCKARELIMSCYLLIAGVGEKGWVHAFLTSISAI